MIGKGRFRGLTLDLSGSSVPHRQSAVPFAAALQRRTGCRLAWHRTRHAFVVLENRGDHCNPKSHFDISLKDLPFNSGLLNWACMTVAFYRGQAANDPQRVLRTCQQYSDDRMDREIASFIDERTPEFTRDMRRIHEILADGRVRQKHFDMATA